MILTEVTSASLVKEGDIFLDDGGVEVATKVASNALRQNIEDSGTETNTDASELKSNVTD